MANKDRVISVEKTVRELQNEIYWNESTKVAIRAFLRTVPAVDAVEVVHGRWEKAFWHPYRCSCCGETALLDRNGEFYCTSNYCPNCGAKMDGERKDNA